MVSGSPPPGSRPPASSPLSPSSSPSSSQSRRDRVWAGLITVAGAVVASWGAAVLAIAGAFLTPFRVGGVLVPVSLLLVVLGNVGLMWFAYDVTGRKFLGLLPGLVWLGVSLIGADRTTEGDLVLIQSNWVATVYLIAGCVAIAGTAYRLFLGPTPPPRR
jgi:hypothetical protein